MDREGPDETTPGRGGGHELRGEPHPPGDARAGDAVAASTSSRVGEGLAKAGGLPEGAPMVGRPAHSGDQASDARFAAVLMAIDGGERGDIEDHLGSEYGEDGWDELLDELFGRTDVRA